MINGRIIPDYQGIQLIILTERIYFTRSKKISKSKVSQKDEWLFKKILIHFRDTHQYTWNFST